MKKTFDKISVKAMKVLKQIARKFTSIRRQLKEPEEVQVHSRMFGNIMEKYFNGGDPLYRIDSRQYIVEFNRAVEKGTFQQKNCPEPPKIKLML
ncbi:MAG: hypothetical protein IJQ85_02380 [Selenomonadaceae bacterium]|nr:hypothetical protein [Selenomonadaceae bacterium]